MPFHAVEFVNFHAWHKLQGPLIQGLNIKIPQGVTTAFISSHQRTRHILANSLLGRHKLISGSIRVLNVDTKATHQNKKEHFGIICCNPKTGIVPHLNCEENLLLPLTSEPAIVGGGLPLWEIFQLFPQLQNVLHTLSANIKYPLKLQLTWARALRTGANIFLFKNLSINLTEENLKQFKALFHYLNQRNYTIILIEEPESCAQHLARYKYNIEKMNRSHYLRI